MQLYLFSTVPTIEQLGKDAIKNKESLPVYIPIYKDIFNNVGSTAFYFKVQIKV